MSLASEAAALGRRIDAAIEGRSGASSLRLREGSLTKAEIAAMSDKHECPTCGKRLTQLEVDHLSQAKASEAARPGEAPGEREEMIRVYESLGVPHAGAEAAVDGRPEFAQSW